MISFCSTFARDFWILTCSGVMWWWCGLQFLPWLTWFYSKICILTLLHHPFPPHTFSVIRWHLMTCFNNLACNHPHPEMACVLASVLMSYVTMIHLPDTESTIVSSFFYHISFHVFQNILHPDLLHIYSWSMWFFHCVIASNIFTVLTINTSHRQE